MLWRPAFFFFFFSCILLCHSSSARSASIDEISQSKYWLRLGHYKSKLFGGYKSEIDGGKFFLSPNGKHSPKDELLATIKAFEESQVIKVGEDQYPAQCLFPLRLKYLETQHGFRYKHPSCPRYEEWRRSVKGDSLSIIFSSYFNGAPASMFGHTFLRTNSKENKEQPLFNHAINFAALTEGDPFILQAVKGMIGSYEGRYTVMPYYVKVKEYNNSDQRDLFEYELNFSPAEVNDLLDHVWELGIAVVDYYFLDDNCSYQLLTMLEVVKQDWDLSSKFSAQVVPIDTIQVVVDQPGALRNVTHRSSLAAVLRSKWDRMTSQEKESYWDTLKERSPPQAVQSTLVADALNTQLTMEQIKTGGKLDEARTQLFRELLVQRSKLPQAKEPDQPLPMPPRPDLGHYTARAGVSAIFRSTDILQELSWRPVLHDWLSDDEGYPLYSDLQAMSLHASYSWKTQRLRLEEFNAISAASLSPIDPLKFGPSYDVGLGFFTPLDCDSCLAFRPRAAVGLSLHPWTERVILYTLAGGQFQFSPGLEKGYRLGPGLQAGVITAPFRHFKLMAQSQMHYWLGRKDQVTFEHSGGASYAFSRRWEMRLTGRLVRSPSRSHTEVIAGLGYSY